jgi:ParB family chromosome partitioning protein
MKIEEVKVNEIKVGNRYRKDMGEISELARNIEDYVLWHPIVITEDSTLIIGHRRLEAFKCLGRETIPARRIDIENITMAEFIENEYRKDYTASERVAIIEALEQEFAKKARERKAQAPNQPRGVKKCSLGQNFAGETSIGRAKDEAAKKVGWSREQYRKAKEVVDSEDEDLIKFMDANNPHSAWTKLKKAQEPEKPKCGRKTFVYPHHETLKSWQKDLELFNRDLLPSQRSHAATHGLTDGLKEKVATIMDLLLQAYTRLDEIGGESRLPLIHYRVSYHDLLELAERQDELLTGAREIVARGKNGKLRVAFLGCTSGKENRKCSAEEMYTGPHFRLPLEYIKSHAPPFDRWFILSAKYGLLKADDIIEPYDQTLRDMNTQERKQWANMVLEQWDKLQEDISIFPEPVGEVFFYCGKP